LYEFVIVVLLGIGTFKLVDMLNEYIDLSKVQTLLTIALGAVVAWALGFSLFSQWDIPARSEAAGYVGTGLMIAAAGYAAPKVFEHVAEVIGGRRSTSLQKAA
jgi:UDP-N-acetylmuramyl pentapeptide phosphotransferase/UDP-N-acetylglucosamine-1-phosphate transferase